MSKLYICTGSCHGQSKVPGSCQAETCELKGQPLTEVEQCDQCGATYKSGDQHTCITN